MTTEFPGWDHLSRCTKTPCMHRITASHRLGLTAAHGGYILTTCIGDGEVFFHSWQTRASEMVVVDNDLASLFPVAPPR